MLEHRVNWQWNRLLAAVALLAVAAVTRPTGSDADTQSTAWTAPAAIATGLTQAAPPSLVYSRDGVAHAIWESNNGLYYAYQLPNRPWSSAVRVASGLSPSMVLDAQGQLNVIFANQFLGNYEIYHIRHLGSTWSLPVNVSHTVGSSGNPVVALASDGTLHAVWMDNTPGSWTVYHGTWNGRFWSSQPVPYARGQVPSMATSPAGTVFVAWQDKVPNAANPTGEYDVLLAELEEGTWSLPLNVSESPGVQSLGVSVTATGDGVAHTTWVDSDKTIQYRYGRGNYWSLPQMVWSASTPAHSPRIIADSEGYLRITWDEFGTIWTTRATAMPAEWPKPDIVATPLASVRGVTMGLLPASGITIGWVEADGPGDYRLYATWQATALERRIWLPLLSR